MVSTTAFVDTTIGAFGPCFNDTPIKAAVPAASPMATSVSPRAIKLERVFMEGTNVDNVTELLGIGNSIAKGTGKSTLVNSVKSFQGSDVEYFKALLSAREELNVRYANVLQTLRTLRARNQNAIRKRNIAKAKRNPKARRAAASAAKTAGAEAGTVATRSEATTTALESVATSGSVEEGAGTRRVADPWHAPCSDINISGVCASPISMDDLDIDHSDVHNDVHNDVQQCGRQEKAMMYMDGMSYSA